MNRRKKHKARKITLIILIAVVLFIIGDLIYSQEFLTVNSFSIKTEKTSASFRAVLISDLHNKEFGKENEILLAKIGEQKPDIIFTVGDMVTQTEETRTKAVSLYNNLTEIADVYACHGNHEQSYFQPNELDRETREAGVHLLVNELEDVEIGGGTITVGGMEKFPYFEYDAPEFNNPERHFFDKFKEKEKENYSILLLHTPECFIWGLQKEHVDLALCGHTHGGIIRLPLIGGLFAPNQGYLAHNGDLLPKYTLGYYEAENARFIITGGLGNEISIPRFNNPPQITVIDFNRDED